MKNVENAIFHNTNVELMLLQYICLKKAPICKCSTRGFKIFCWCWPSFLTWQVSSLFHLQYVHKKLKQTLVTCGQQRSRVCLNFLWLYGRSNKIETCQVFLFLICLKNTIFCVCSCSELMQVKFVTKFNTEAQIDLPPKQLEGWLRWQMKDIYCIYNFVEDVIVFFFGIIKFVISDQFHFIIFEIVSL